MTMPGECDRVEALWLLPQNPGPFAPLAEWKTWRDELAEVGTKGIGVDAEIEIAAAMIELLENNDGNST